jgi:hypothetical protein
MPEKHKMYSVFVMGTPHVVGMFRKRKNKKRKDLLTSNGFFGIMKYVAAEKSGDIES